MNFWIKNNIAVSDHLKKGEEKKLDRKTDKKRGRKDTTFKTILNYFMISSNHLVQTMCSTVEGAQYGGGTASYNSYN